MKNWSVFILFMIFGVHAANAQKVNWMSLNEAVKAQATHPKKIIMDVYTDWCGPCKMLDKNTFQNPDVAKYINEHFYAVKFNAEGDEEIFYQDQTFKNPDFNPSSNGRNSMHELSQALQITSYPTIIFFDETSKPIMPIIGYQSPNQLELYLKLFLKDDHKKIESEEQWKAYQENFSFEFKG